MATHASEEERARRLAFDTTLQIWQNLPQKLSIERLSEHSFALVIQGATLQIIQRSNGEKFNMMGGLSDKKETVSYGMKLFGKNAGDPNRTMYDGPIALELILPNKSTNNLGIDGKALKVLIKQVGQIYRFSSDVNHGRLNFVLPGDPIVLPRSYSKKIETLDGNVRQLFVVEEQNHMYRIVFLSSPLYSLDRDENRLYFEKIGERVIKIRLIKCFQLHDHSSIKLRAIIDYPEAKFTIPDAYDIDNPTITGTPDGDNMFVFALKVVRKEGGGKRV